MQSISPLYLGLVKLSDYILDLMVSTDSYIPQNRRTQSFIYTFHPMSLDYFLITIKGTTIGPTLLRPFLNLHSYSCVLDRGCNQGAESTSNATCYKYVLEWQFLTFWDFRKRSNSFFCSTFAFKLYRSYKTIS